MAKVAVITDSTACIPEELGRGLPLRTIPLHVIFGEEMFLDGENITPTEFYNKLEASSIMPTTSQPTPAAFASIYMDLMEKGYDVLSIVLSSKLSGTMDSAVQAKKMVRAANIEIVDSKVAGMALGFLAVQVARMAAQGATLQECAAAAEKAKEQCGVLFLVDTLEYLRRGGRIGGAAAMLGTALNLKPILEVVDGKIEAAGKVRTFNKALDTLVDKFVQRVDDRRPLRLAVMHARAEDQAQDLMERVRRRFGATTVTDSVVSEISPVLGTHTGPGALGLVYMTGF